MGIMNYEIRDAHQGMCIPFFPGKHAEGGQNVKVIDFHAASVKSL